MTAVKTTLSKLPEYCYFKFHGLIISAGFTFLGKVKDQYWYTDGLKRRFTKTNKVVYTDTDKLKDGRK